MNESKHTPGPWIVAPSRFKSVEDGGGIGVCVSPEFSKQYNRGFAEPEAWEANAALIAAAPDMQYALAETADRLSAWSDSLREWINHDQGTPEKREEWQNEADNYERLLALIMPALAKAEGR